MLSVQESAGGNSKAALAGRVVADSDGRKVTSFQDSDAPVTPAASVADSTAPSETAVLAKTLATVLRSHNQRDGPISIVVQSPSGATTITAKRVPSPKASALHGGGSSPSLLSPSGVSGPSQQLMQYGAAGPVVAKSFASLMPPSVSAPLPAPIGPPMPPQLPPHGHSSYYTVNNPWAGYTPAPQQVGRTARVQSPTRMNRAVFM